MQVLIQKCIELLEFLDVNPCKQQFVEESLDYYLIRDSNLSTKLIEFVDAILSECDKIVSFGDKDMAALHFLTDLLQASSGVFEDLYDIEVFRHGETTVTVYYCGHPSDPGKGPFSLVVEHASVSQQNHRQKRKKKKR